MAQDLMTKFYTCMNFRLEEKLSELTKIIDQSSANKELQALFPQIVNNIFSSSFNNCWNLKTIAYDTNRYEFEALMHFLEPQGPMFRLCYKLLSDPQLKYNLELNVLPLDLQMSLERGRCSQFYADMLIMDPQTMKVVALALNPFDYYILNFALHLVNSGQYQTTWENWNSAYFALACDYLMHFLHSDPNVAVTPHIPNYTGKVPMAAPLQTANRPLCNPSLLLIPDLCGINEQHTSQNSQSRNEVWRSETVLQVFIDIWLSVEEFSPRDIEMYQRNYQASCSSPDRVRTVRVMVKHLHSFSAQTISDPASRSSALRKYARQLMCARAYNYVKYLVATWPLDASFRLVMELWLSLIQPWRYTNNAIDEDRYPGSNHNQDEVNVSTLDGSFIQFIAENFPSYTGILQLVLPRFMRMDLTAYKNAVMLFRLGKVFSQPHLTPILRNLEAAIADHNLGTQHGSDASHNTSAHDHSYMYNGVALHRWVAIAKQAISELNMSTNFEYEPIWSEDKVVFAMDFVKKIHSAKLAAEHNADVNIERLSRRRQDLWTRVRDWFMIEHNSEDKMQLEECKKVPVFLNSSVHYFLNIFMLSENPFFLLDPVARDSALENSSFTNDSNLFTVTKKLRDISPVQYMGDPDLMPIASYENTILVRILYQISSKINELYGAQLSDLWNKNNFWGYVAREVLQRPCTIRTYVKDAAHQQRVASAELPARLSLRRIGSHSALVWLAVGYVLFRLFSYSGYFYTCCLLIGWMLLVLTKSTFKMLRINRT